MLKRDSYSEASVSEEWCARDPQENKGRRLKLVSDVVMSGLATLLVATPEWLAG